MIPAVQRWHEIAQKEIDRVRNPLPVEHILVLIERESRGRAGALNPTRGDSGLMQVIPESLQTYNANHQQKYTIQQLRGTSNSDAAIQIRVGLWILSHYVKKVYKYLKSKIGSVSLDDLVKLADASYASGWGNVKPKLDRLQNPTWDALKTKFPNWGRIEPGEKIWKRANEEGATWSLPAIDRWLEGEIQIDDGKKMNGAIIGILIIIIAWAMFGRKK